MSTLIAGRGEIVRLGIGASQSVWVDVYDID